MAVKPDWDRKAFDAWQKSLPPTRRPEDAAILKTLFDLAADSPTLTEILRWAAAHDVAFYVDHASKGVMGHYSPGTGVVGLSLEAIRKNPLGVLGTLAHETRHAWQDFHGLRKDLETPDLVTAIITQSMIEADAAAFGVRVREEYLVALMVKGGNVTPAVEAYLKKPVAENLAEKFLEWFKSKKPASYGARTASRYARDIFNKAAAKETAVPQNAPRNYEFSSSAVLPTRLDIRNVQDVMPLGASFSGGYNYFSKLGPDALPKLIIRPALARSFWGGADAQYLKLTNQVRKVDILNNRGKMKRHPWP